MTFKASSHAPNKEHKDMKLLQNSKNFDCMILPLEKNLA